MSKVNYQTAIKVVTKKIKKDKDLRLSWEANIAMAFKDQFHFSGHQHETNVVHEIANKAAAAFIDQLIGRKWKDLPGNVALAKLHIQSQPLSDIQN